VRSSLREREVFVSSTGPYFLAAVFSIPPEMFLVLPQKCFVIFGQRLFRVRITIRAKKIVKIKKRNRYLAQCNPLGKLSF
jgi:hypothetical protein